MRKTTNGRDIDEVGNSCSEEDILVTPIVGILCRFRSLLIRHLRGGRLKNVRHEAALLENGSCSHYGREAGGKKREMHYDSLAEKRSESDED